MRKHLSVNGFVMLAIVFALTACGTSQTGKVIEEGQPTAGAEGSVIDLEQGWTEDTQQAFYFTPQGSRIMPYSWYLHLEQADSTRLFRSNDNMTKLRYLPSEPSDWNSDGLAVGFTKYVDSNNEAWMGLTCAACHTAQISYDDKDIRIDGGPTLGDFQSFNAALVLALNATLDVNEKFNRFANEVLGSDHTANQANALRNALLKQTEVLATRNQVNHSDPNQPDYGYGRVDAIGAIFNPVLTVFAGLPNNGRASNAPVSYPFLWGTHQSDVVQWTGFAPNGPLSLGALIRNGGEVLGVYGDVQIPDDLSKVRYQSSLAIKNLGLLEQWVAELRAPQWPNEILPPIDAVKAAKGAVLYQTHCVECHQVVPAEEEGKPYKAVLTPLSEIKTDPQEIKNMLALRPAGRFTGRKEFGVAGTTIAS
jgi:mono/diheme cytochrome c family protein